MCISLPLAIVTIVLGVYPLLQYLTKEIKNSPNDKLHLAYECMTAYLGK